MDTYTSEQSQTGSITAYQPKIGRELVKLRDAVGISKIAMQHGAVELNTRLSG